MHATDADEMTPQQRLDEIADILAGGFLRLSRRPGHAFGASHVAESRPENSSKAQPELTGLPGRLSP